MTPPDLKGMRFRTPSLVQTVEKPRSDYTNLKTGKHYVKERGEVVTRREAKSMYDVSTPDFRERSARGEVINSPMYATSEDFTYPLVNLAYGDERNAYSATAHLPMIPTRLTNQEGIFTNNYDNAIIDAYANISANDGNTLLWLGEFKETVSMLTDIGKGLRVLYEKTKKQRVQWAKGKLTIEAQQQLTLQILYGVLPLEQQIADFLAGLFSIKQADSRQTARGYRVKSKSQSYSVTNTNFNVDGYITSAYMAVTEESLDVSVRAGVLYDVDITDVPWLGIILDPKAVVSTAYALSRLSFVLDWIVNVGGILTAWAPSMGTNILSAWVTVEETHIQVVKYLPTIEQLNYRSTPDGGYTRILRKKWRKPIDRSDLAVIPRLDVNLDLEKLAAMVLLFAKIRKSI